MVHAWCLSRADLLYRDKQTNSDGLIQCSALYSLRMASVWLQLVETTPSHYQYVSHRTNINILQITHRENDPLWIEHNTSCLLLYTKCTVIISNRIPISPASFHLFVWDKLHKITSDPQRRPDVTSRPKMTQGWPLKMLPNKTLSTQILTKNQR